LSKFKRNLGPIKVGGIQVTQTASFLFVES